MEILLSYNFNKELYPQGFIETDLHSWISTGFEVNSKCNQTFSLCLILNQALFLQKFLFVAQELKNILWFCLQDWPLFDFL